MARFYRADIQQYKPVSTEITGYAASAFVFLYCHTKDEAYLDRARLAARFLCEHAWDPGLQTFPFEYPSPSAASDHHSYFFDCGIIIRGLLAVWKMTREDRLLETAAAAARGMIADFHSGAEYHPILILPGKIPLGRNREWSKMPGCYQGKSALAWWEVAEATGERTLRDAYLEVLDAGLRTHRDYLPGAAERPRVMDRLHPYVYFLESMTPVLDRPDCLDAYRWGLQTVSGYLRDIAPEFARSDVYAQLLRARVYAAGVIPVDLESAREEASALEGFRSTGGDPRVDGAFLFGQRGGTLVPHANPVSTIFAMQALEVWRAFEAGEANPCLLPPI